MIVPVSNVGQIGIVSPLDLPARQIPLNAWTAGRNVRFRDGMVEKFSGHSEVYPTPLWAPVWLMPIASGNSYYWIYAGEAKVGATDGNTHADITRTAGGDYTFDPTIGWTGTAIEGIAVINNGQDVPQMWTPGLANDLTTLTAWNANHRARAMRSLRRYLIALDITKSGVHNPYMIKWSHAAPANGVPTSWDEADETLDAGEFDLPADGGWLTDAFPIRDNLMVYKEYESWLMQYVGGIDIFRFNRAFSSFGAVNRRCAAEFFGGKHIVYTGDDVVVHDSQQAKSVLDFRARRLLNSVIDSANFKRAFIAVNFRSKEVWICGPEIGNTWANKALVWNWLQDTFGVRDLPNAAFIAPGIVNPTDSSSIWSGAVGVWDTDTLAWGDRSFTPGQRDMLMALPEVTKLMLADSTQQFAGVNMQSYVEREGLGFPLKLNTPPDFETRKLLTGIWPRISGTQGQTVNVYVGTQSDIGGPVSWGPPRPYLIGTTKYIDCRVNSRLHALRFESTGNFEWKLEGYDVEVTPIGRS